MSNTDQPVRFDDKTKRFIPVDRDNAKQIAKTAPEGWYVVLKNPASNGKQPQSQQGKLSSSELDVGKKVIIPGPASFCLWPGQMAKILKGHHLRSNQYLLVRVYDEAEARKNWSQAVVKAANPSVEGTDSQDPQDPLKDPPVALPISLPIAENLTMGQVLVIKGIDVSFYIPPTGVEVIPDKDVVDDDGNAVLVREAVTLERLEYCLLMDESGNKRYERGPMVVFPKPTEVFVENEDARKFEAIELSNTSGIYIKVISAYEEGGKSYKVGDELFITGKEQMIYFPREEHAIIKYDKNEIHYSIAIPAGEARYVLDRNTGIVSLIKGPTVFLPDPRKQVVVRRILDYKTCSLLFPNNYTAFQHNAKLAGTDVDTYMSQQGAAIVAGAAAAAMSCDAPEANFYASAGLESADVYGATRSMLRERIGSKASSRGLAEKASQEAVGNAFQRKTKYQEPRTITLLTKYGGAVALNIYTCYAMMLVRSDGGRRVVQGPQTVLLEYDETPEILELSTGKPKTTDNLLRTAYLRVSANRISDIVEIETRDFCRFELKISYRMDFEGEPDKWFNVENHVKFLCDHMRSKLKNSARSYNVEEFYGDSTNIIRDIVLGVSDDDDEENDRGFTFEENGMRVYDVEVLKVELKDRDISEMIASTQKETIKSAIRVASQKRELEVTEQLEALKQKVKEAEAATTAKGYELSIADAKLKRAADEKVIEAAALTAAQRAKVEFDKANEQAKIQELNRKNRQADIAIEVEDLDKKQSVKIALLEAEVKAVVERAKAIGPDLIAALQAFGDAALTEKVASAMAPLAILGGTSVAEVIHQLLSGTKLENVARMLAAKSPTNPDPVRR